MMSNGRWKDTLLLAGGIIVGVGLGLAVLALLGINRIGGPSMDFAQAGNVPAAPKVGALAPDFELERISGELLRLEELRGQPVVVNFWATWCIPCEIEMPLLQDRYEKHPELHVLAVNFAEPASEVQVFVDKHGLTFDILLDPRAIVQTAYRVRGYPTTYFIDAEGVVQAVHIGILLDKQLDGYLKDIGVSG
jgi:cytochrome c biogenesis protein CcmG, thiol:disulfide interchange protein DsbE